MKNKLLSLAVALVVLGCTSTQQKISYNSAYSLEQSTTAAFDAYLVMINRGIVSSNDLPKIGKAYDRFQLSLTLAVNAVHFNTNALLPYALAVESQNVINLINNLKGGQ